MDADLVWVLRCDRVEHQADTDIRRIATGLRSTRPDGLNGTVQIGRMPAHPQVQTVGGAAAHLNCPGTTGGDPHRHLPRVVEGCGSGRADLDSVAGQQCPRSHHRRFEFGNGGRTLAEETDSGVTDSEHQSGPARRDVVDGADRVGEDRPGRARRGCR